MRLPRLRLVADLPEVGLWCPYGTGGDPVSNGDWLLVFVGIIAFCQVVGLIRGR